MAEENFENMFPDSDIIAIDPDNRRAIDALFGGDGDGGTEEREEEEAEPEEKETEERQEEDTDDDVRGKGGKNQESVGAGGKEPSEDDGGREEEEETEPEDGDGSPNDISSIAKALYEDGLLFDTLDESAVNEIDSVDKFRESIEAHVKNLFDEKTRSLMEALDNGVDVSELNRYDSLIEQENGNRQYLAGLTDSMLEDESDEGAQIRRQLIFNSYLRELGNEDKAKKLTKRSFDSGNDVDDAREALENLKEITDERIDKFEKAKENLIRESRENMVKIRERYEKMVLEEPYFGDLQVDPSTRDRILKASTVKRRMKDGRQMTEIEAARASDPVAFDRNVNALYVLTDGFSNLEKLTGIKVKKEIKKQNDNLENLLKRGDFMKGNPRLASGVATRRESSSGKSKYMPYFGNED